MFKPEVPVRSPETEASGTAVPQSARHPRSQQGGCCPRENRWGLFQKQAGSQSKTSQLQA